MSGSQLSNIGNDLQSSLVKLNQWVAPLKQPARVAQLRRAVLVLALLWLVFACAQFVWALLPSSDAVLPPQSAILNPVESAGEQEAGAIVDINELLSWHLLGKADQALAETPVIVPTQQTATGREGIEEGARETNLALRLRGIVSSSSDGLGHAIIEHKSKQQVYAVEDKLPLSGRVLLAKVMRDRVVIDNRGTYELLLLFEDSPLSAQALTPPPPSSPETDLADRFKRAIDKRGDTIATLSAQALRETLYKNPQSLADIVQVSAVRQDGALQGYKVAPGSDSAQFQQLGFMAGDMITSVNGIALDDPGNTVRLYQLMRSAEEAVFDLERNGELLSVSVSLGATSAEQ